MTNLFIQIQVESTEDLITEEIGELSTDLVEVLSKFDLTIVNLQVTNVPETMN